MLSLKLKKRVSLTHNITGGLKVTEEVCKDLLWYIYQQYSHVASWGEFPITHTVPLLCVPSVLIDY